MKVQVSFTIQILDDEITITSVAPPVGKKGVAYMHKFTASGGSGQYKWSLVSGPSWLTVNSDGVLFGMPPAAGQYDITIEVDNA